MKPLTNQVISYFHISWFSETDGPGKRLVLFLQGCPLDCVWCHSPHSQPVESPLLYFDSLCDQCHTCVDACKNRVHSFENGIHYIQRDRCTQCGHCVEACPKSSQYTPGGALVLPTKMVDADELFESIMPHLYLLGSDGGITFSGGEALFQSEMVTYLAQRCHEAGIHTALETSGIVAIKTLQKIAPFIDTWLFGLRLDTGTSSYPLTYLRNKTQCALQFLTQDILTEIIVRIPAIPNYTDSKFYLERAQELIETYSLQKIEVLPFNPESAHFYHALGIRPKLQYQKHEADEALKTIQTFFNIQNQNQLTYETIDSTYC